MSALAASTSYTVASTGNSGTPGPASGVVVSNASCPAQSSASINGSGNGEDQSDNCAEISAARATVVGMGAGLGVGVPLTAALAGALFLLWRERRRARKVPVVMQPGEAARELAAGTGRRAGTAELSGRGPSVHEMGHGIGSKVELPAFLVKR